MQIDKLVGLTAPADFVKELEELANTHHEKAFLDVIRAYHFGARYIVELEVEAPRLLLACSCCPGSLFHTRAACFPQRQMVG